ncbi:MAG: Sec-independent protein translocase protein TatB [Rhodobacteraceae bacterium]|nr:Sec-independent protein translocase protein TatB [Paracoccaceae bacterium]
MDIGWTELLVIGVVALIVVGPKDLPMMFRALGRFTGRMRGMARDFQRAMDDAARETGVRDMANDIRKAASPMSSGLDRLNAAADRFEKWDPLKGGSTPRPPGGTAGTPAASAPAAAAPAMGPATAALAEERRTEAQAIMAANAERTAARKAPEAAPEASPPPASPAQDPGP